MNPNHFPEPFELGISVAAVVAPRLQRVSAAVHTVSAAQQRAGVLGAMTAELRASRATVRDLQRRLAAAEDRANRAERLALTLSRRLRGA